MNKTIANIIAAAEQSKKDVKEILMDGVLTDKATPLEERWEMFVAMEKAGLLPCESYGDGFIEVLFKGGSLYDDFYIERHQTTRYPELLEGALDNEDKAPNAKDIIQWKEEVLKAGQGSFTYDW